MSNRSCHELRGSPDRLIRRPQEALDAQADRRRHGPDSVRRPRRLRPWPGRRPGLRDRRRGRPRADRRTPRCRRPNRARTARSRRRSPATAREEGAGGPPLTLSLSSRASTPRMRASAAKPASSPPLPTASSVRRPRSAWTSSTRAITSSPAVIFDLISIRPSRHGVAAPARGRLASVAGGLASISSSMAKKKGPRSGWERGPFGFPAIGLVSAGSHRSSSGCGNNYAAAAVARTRPGEAAPKPECSNLVPIAPSTHR